MAAAQGPAPPGQAIHGQGVAGQTPEHEPSRYDSKHRAPRHPSRWQDFSPYYAPYCALNALVHAECAAFYYSVAQPNHAANPRSGRPSRH
ncbi:hypothetical protein MTBLM5_20217 [Magnetospirillum sp. LM-5]|nr:hypothetical protein MTBLM5_20217 [Magnetospirillum sp. LM-5]